jgi:hypothetical protein
VRFGPTDPWGQRGDCSPVWDNTEGELTLLLFLLSPSYLVYSSTLKTEATCPSETSDDFHRITRRYIPENRTLHNHRCENLKLVMQNSIRGKHMAYIRGFTPPRDRDYFLSPERPDMLWGPPSLPANRNRQDTELTLGQKRWKPEAVHSPRVISSLRIGGATSSLSYMCISLNYWPAMWVSTVSKLWAGRPGFDWSGEGTFLSLTALTPALGPIRTPAQWITETFPRAKVGEVSN